MSLSDAVSKENYVPRLHFGLLVVVPEQLFDELIHSLDVLGAMSLDPEHRRVAHSARVCTANNLNAQNTSMWVNVRVL